MGDFQKSKNFAENSPFLPPEQNQAILALTKDLEAIQEVDEKALGVLLPLTGTFKAFGQRVLSAMSIAWDIPLPYQGEPFTIATKQGIKIIIADSKGEPKQAELMVDELVKKYHVALIIGDIIQEPSFFAAKRAHFYHVPMLSLSRHPEMENLEGIFIFTSSLQEQVKALVHHALFVQGHKRFGILYPRHTYGITMSQLFFENVIENKGEVTAIEAYQPTETNLSIPIKKLLGTYYLNARKECSHPALSCKEKLSPIVNFEALFIPDFQNLAVVIPTLWQENLLITSDEAVKKSYQAATKISPHYVQVLGIGNFNDPHLLKKIGSQMNGAYFVDTVSFEESGFKEFSELLKELSGSTPTALEVYAHDGAKLSLKILETFPMTDRNDMRAFYREKIASFNEKVGLLDHLSFKKNGELTTKKFGFQVTDGQAHLSESKGF